MSKKNKAPHQAKLVNTVAGQEGRMTFSPFWELRNEMLKLSPAYQEGQKKRKKGL